MNRKDKPGTVKTKPKVRVIGVGNLHRSDDGVGPYVSYIVAGLVKTNLTHKEGLSKVVCQSVGDDLMNLLSTWESDEVVIMVDAVISTPKLNSEQPKDDQPVGKDQPVGEPADNKRKTGAIHFFDLKKEIPSSALFRFSTHTLSPLQIAKMALDLDMAPKQLLLYAIEGDQFSFSNEASLHPEVEKSAQKVAAEIIEKFCVGEL